MNMIYLLPFSYFYNTRLRNGSWAFHALFEWLSAAILVMALGSVPPFQALIQAILVYFAFISLYEIGYLVNDLFAARKEKDGRRRGPQNAPTMWVFTWIAFRIMAFIALTILLDMQEVWAWWSFFLALSIVFALHNIFVDREFKAATFLWLAWFRFMAPVIFVVEDRYRMGIALAASISYAAFRLFGYLDSKGLLKMPGRQRIRFRLVFFLMPLTGVLALAPYDEARGFVLLCAVYSIIALAAAGSSWLRHGHLD